MTNEEEELEDFKNDDPIYAWILQDLKLSDQLKMVKGLKALQAGLDVKKQRAPARAMKIKMLRLQQRRAEWLAW